ncbi:MAG TPA: 2-C-methyl-D-erythritol 4-phosphate cytidylyltransferase, partial [Anseongella sp.]|nr:2-C-methyl-D-erythritol 4-phosphate cytidylyltransferase [Anseongella sp.]
LPFRNEFTDDASVVEKAGETIYLVRGEARNIKITYPDDLKIAAALL